MTLLKPVTSSITSTESYYWGIVAGLLLFSLLSVTDVFANTMDNVVDKRESETELGSNDNRYLDMGLKYIEPSGEVRVEMPLDTQVTMTVSGMLNRVIVRQVFSNPTSDWLDGQYRFPLPTNAAIDGLTMKLGDRVVKGIIQPKEQAKRTFTNAKASGRKASLLEQQRPNIFTTSVANLAPNEKLVVEISYQELVTFEGGRYSLRYPMTITPRYYPPGSRALQMDGNVNRLLPALEADSESKSESKLAHGISLEVLLRPGFVIDSVDSPYHKVSVEPAAGEHYRVTLQSGYVTNKDFVLNWQGAVSFRPEAALFIQEGLTHKPDTAERDTEVSSQFDPLTERVGMPSNKAKEAQQQTTTAQLVAKEAYGLLMFIPPALDRGLSDDVGQSQIPRELTLVIDTSGSMSGESIEQAKSAVLNMLDTLTPCGKSETESHCDSFNLLAFNHKTRSLFPQGTPATSQNLSLAKQFVSKLEAQGGTEMMSALVQALPTRSTNQVNEDNHRLKQVVFITDGAVGNEKALFDTIADRLGERRLFTVGIGSAPNSHFMERAAQLGRGSFTYIGKTSEVKQKITALSKKISRPSLTNILVTYSDGTLPDYWPAIIPDLYLGEPLTIAIKMDSNEQRDLWVSGAIGGQAWHRQLTTNQIKAALPTERPAGLDLVWARKQIAHLELNKRPMTASKVKQQVTGLAMKYHLMSAYTSLVAVDMSQDAKTAMPLGQEKQKGKVTPHRPAGQGKTLNQGQTLPQTASWSQFYLYGGAVLLMMSLLLFVLSIVFGARRNLPTYETSI